MLNSTPPAASAAFGHRVSVKAYKAQYFFLHIPKTGGTAFTAYVNAPRRGKSRLPELKNCIGANDCCTCSHAGSCYVDPELNETVWGKDSSLFKECNVVITEATMPGVRLAAGTRLLTLIRKPLTHVRSMYAHCQQLKQYNHSYRKISFDDWIQWRTGRLEAMSNTPTKALSEANPSAFVYCRYDPLDLQTHSLDQRGDLTAAAAVIERAFWVGVTEEFNASICLLRAKLAEAGSNDSLQQGPPLCAPCPNARGLTRGRRTTAIQSEQPPIIGEAGQRTTITGTTRNESRSHHKGPHDDLHNRGTHTDDVPIAGETYRLVQSLTRKDTVIHGLSIARLYRELSAYNLICYLSTEGSGAAATSANDYLNLKAFGTLRG